MRDRALLLLMLAALPACSRPAGLFVEANARAHIGMLSDTIGSRPVGTAANARAREYIVDQLKTLGFDVRVQETDARRQEIGRTARVANIIGVLPGERAEALGLVTHYDSSPDTPGAGDDALGVGVAIEAARVLAATAPRRWTLMVIATDGEESGLMGAAALVTDRTVMDRLQAYINLESIGSAGVPVLFETGPGNAWIVSPWARRAPHPRGGSYGLEVYRRLPNDTDFSILKTRDVPGLNFAAVDGSHAYHTARDTVDRLSRVTVRTMGENVVSIAAALQDVDITQRSAVQATYFDVGGTIAVAYGPRVQLVLSILALVAGAVAWVRMSAEGIRLNGVPRWLFTLAWAWIGAAAVVAAMAGATWLLRASREVYHPWYAAPGRLFTLLVLAGATAGWSMARIGRWLPRGLHTVRSPAIVWSAALPAWIGAAALTLGYAPAASYLWVLPLLAAGVLLAAVPSRSEPAVRAASLLVLAASASLWLRETHDLLRFIVSVMGRLTIVTPAPIYAVVVGCAGLMVVPPLVALLIPARPLRRPWIATSLLLLAVAAAFGYAYAAPAYTRESPLRRFVRVLQDVDAAGAIWEVASVEPGLDLGPGAPERWTATDGSVAASIPWGRFALPFTFRSEGPPLGPAPIAVTGFALTPLPEGLQLAVAVVPREAGLTVSFVLPPGVVPARSSLPGRERLGRWSAAFAAPPAEGIGWEARFHDVTPEQLRATRIAVTSSRIPGGSGWQSLPSWLPQETAVWSAGATWVVAAAPPLGIAPVPPLR